MTPESHTEVTRRGWFGRLGGAFKGILVGLVLMGVATWLLFSNEGRAVRRARTLKEGGGAVVAVSAERADPTFEGRLVHISGQTVTDAILTDPEFMVTADSIHLERTVEMYQWKENEDRETKKKLGGGTETTTTYSYSKAWSERAVPSRGFRVPEGHQNPDSLPYSTRRVSAGEVDVGAFRLSSGLVGRINRFEPLTVRTLDLLPTSLRWKAKLHGGGFYIGENPSTPQIGDIRVIFRYVAPTVVSAIGRQMGSGLGPYVTSNGGTIELLAYGTVTPDLMFQAAEKSNSIMTWLLRLGGLLLMVFGFRLVFRPLSVMADVLPFLGNIVEAGTGFVSFLLAAFLSASIVAVAWVFYRPLVGLMMIAVAIALAVAVVAVLRKAGRRRVVTDAAGS
jgi:hypothetical protein